MLKKIRLIARGIASKILMMLFILAFGAWGIEDMLQRSDGNETIATVGDTKISKNEYNQSLYYETEKLRQSLNQQFSPEIIKNLGLESYVLQSLVDRRLLVLESKKLGLQVSNTEVAAHISKSPEFLDDKGKFSKSIFKALLRAKNKTEKSYIQQLREDMEVNLLLTSLTTLATIPENATNTLLVARQEQRTIDIYTISPSLIHSLPTPDEEQLKEYYDSNIAEFTAPEYRTLSYVALSAEDAKKLSQPSKPSNDDIETIYHQRIDEFKKPQRREVEQLLFGSEEAAHKAYDAIQSGESFEQVAKKSNILNPKAISLGIIEKSNILEEAAEQVFSQMIDTISKPIKSSFGWHIFRVKEIIPSTTLSLEEVRQKLEKELEQQTSENALNHLSNKLEDAIAGGSTLSEAAKELGLKIINLQPVNKDGMLINGTMEKSLPEDKKILYVAFKTDEKTESSLITTKNGINYIVRVENIIPEHVKPLDEVKSKLISSWTDKEKSNKLIALAKKIENNFSVASRENTIKTYNLPAPATFTISQNRSSIQEIPALMIADIFSRSVGDATNSFAQDGKSDYKIAVIKEIIPVQINEKDQKYITALSNISKEYKMLVQNEIIQQYLRFLASKYKISVNMEALKMENTK